MPRPGNEQFLHELANLLDASSRNLQLVINRSNAATDPETAVVPADLLSRLQVAQDGMTQMATLMHRWMRHLGTATGLFEQDKTIAQAADQAVQLLTPSASAQGISLSVRIPQDVAALPAGPLFPVIFNALRNSIDAFAAESPTADKIHERTGAVTLTAHTHNDQVHLTITDDGPGLDPTILSKDGSAEIGKTTKPNGHGVGLALCRQIVQGLGGTIQLSNEPSGGAVFVATFPITHDSG